MDEVIKKINNDIEKIKVIQSKEKNIDTNTEFIALKTGDYTLNNGSTITREGVFKKKVKVMRYVSLL